MPDSRPHLVVYALREVRRSVTFFARDYATQVTDASKAGGLDLFVYEGLLRGLEVIRDCEADSLYDASLLTALWNFANDVRSLYETCSGDTDAEVLRFPRWDQVRETASRLLLALPPELSEDDVQNKCRLRT